MFLQDEQLRQSSIRSMELIDDIEDAAKLYEKGWSIPEIAESKGIPIRELTVELRSYVSVEPKDIEFAEVKARFEERAIRYKKRNA